MHYRLLKIFEILLIISTSFISTSCLESPENFKLLDIAVSKITLPESQLLLKCRLYNPNTRAILIKKMDVKVIVEGFTVATIKNNGNFRLRKQSDTDFEAVLKLQHLDVLKAAPIVALKPILNLRVEGEYKAGTWLYSKNVTHTQNLTVSPQSEIYKLLMRVIQSKVFPKKD